jgi:hypothetical protein
MKEKNKVVAPILALLPLVLTLANCGPISPEVAARQCTDRARAAAAPQGEAMLGISSDGPIANARISISSDFISGRDPYEVYDSCVREKTGQGPIMPLVL